MSQQLVSMWSGSSQYVVSTCDDRQVLDKDSSNQHACHVQHWHNNIENKGRRHSKERTITWYTP